MQALVWLSLLLKIALDALPCVVWRVAGVDGLVN